MGRLARGAGCGAGAVTDEVEVAWRPLTLKGGAWVGM